MKKIISLICAAILLFSFSAVAYAHLGITEKIIVTADLNPITPAGTKEEIGEIEQDGVKAKVYGRVLQISYIIENEAKSSITADILNEFKVTVKDGDKDVKVLSKEFINIDLKNTTIDPSKVSEKIVCKIKVNTENSVDVYVTYKDITKDTNSNDNKIEILYEEETSTSKVTETSTAVTETSTTTTTTEATKQAETEASTTVTTHTESTKSNTAVIIMDLPDSPNTEAPIEDEIPNTGSTKAIYAAAALAIAGAVALLIIKKKSDD